MKRRGFLATLLALPFLRWIPRRDDNIEIVVLADESMSGEDWYYTGGFKSQWGGNPLFSNENGRYSQPIRWVHP